jgi:hypothetical protein
VKKYDRIVGIRKEDGTEILLKLNHTVEEWNYNKEVLGIEKEHLQSAPFSYLIDRNINREQYVQNSEAIVNANTNRGGASFKSLLIMLIRRTSLLQMSSLLQTLTSLLLQTFHKLVKLIDK